MKICVSPFTKGSAGRLKFARPQTSGTHLFKELNFFGHTKTHICIHLRQKCAARSVPAVDLKGTWAIVCADVNFSLLDVRHKERIVPSKCSPDAAASFAVAGMWKDVFMGKRVNKVKDPTFWWLEKAFPDDQCRQAVLQRCLFLPSTLFLQPSTPHFLPLCSSRWALHPSPLTVRGTADRYSSACELLYLKTHTYGLWPKSHQASAAATERVHSVMMSRHLLPA